MYKMMIVDDSNIIRQKISRARNADRFDVVATASDGEQAVRMFVDNHPDIVTMDLTMPHMDGLECITSLVNVNPDVQILVVSALSDDATGIEALERGACGFLPKPFTDAQLNEALDEMMENVHV